jgi:hypothetical protein
MKPLKRSLILVKILVFFWGLGQVGYLNSLDKNSSALTKKDFSEIKLNNDKEKKKEFKRFFKGKEHVYRMNWAAAKEGFDEYLADFSTGQFRDEALYWLSYSLNKLSREQKDPYKIIAFKEEAMKKLDLLAREYANSPWLDDARMLRIEIAGELVLMGKDYYKKYINDAQYVKNVDMKMLAIDKLMKIDSEIAVPTLKKIIKTGKDPQLRKKSVYILGKYSSIDAIEILEEASEKDESEDVRKEALFWLAQVKKQMSPVKLSYYMFSARITDPLEFKRLPENKPTTFLLDKDEGIFSFVSSIFRNELRNKINRLFHHKLVWLNKYTGVKKITEFDNDTVVTFTFNGFWIRIPCEKIKRESDCVKGEVLFHNLVEDKRQFVPFSVDRKKDLLIGVRRGDRVSLVVLRAVRGKPTPVYAVKPRPKVKALDTISAYEIDLLEKSILSLEKNLGNIGEGDVYRIYSDNKTMNIKIEQGRIRIIYEKARAEIKSPGGKWHVRGQLVLLIKERQLIANDATLISPAGKTVIEKNSFTIPLDNPEKYQVSGKKKK